MFFKRILFPGIISLMVLSLSGAVELTPYGGLRLENQIDIYRRTITPSGKGIKKLNRSAFRAGKISSGQVEGVYLISQDLEASFTAILRKNTTGIYEFSSMVQPPAEAEKLSLGIDLSSDQSTVVKVNGTEIRLPETYRKHTLYSAHSRQLQLWVGLAGYTITGSFNLEIQDLRKNNPAAGWRIVFRNTNVLNLSRELPQALPVDISASANRGLSDKVAGDGLGGWTDQGPEQDLSGLKTGLRKYAGIEFNIIDPTTNNPNATIVISGHDYKFPQIATLQPQINNQFEYLYLLHASAWGPKNGERVGMLEISYSDGSNSNYPIIRGVDCGDTWNPVISYRNAKIGIRLPRKNSASGLYVSAFILDRNKQLAGITFRAGQYIWGIAGVSLGNWPLPEKAEPPYIIKAGPEWRPIDNLGEIMIDSPLDFSSGLDAPAGKHGWLKANKDGHFEFENTPGHRIRFIGTNLVQSAIIPSHEETDRLVRRLAASGFNAVRLHHHETQLMDHKATDTLHFDNARLERFDYLVHRLKEAGIYITMDLHSSRRIKPGDRIAECEQGTARDRKALTPISPTALTNWKEYVKPFLSRINTYTGKSILEDPAFVFFTLDNEGCLLQWWRARPTPVAAIYHEWLREQGKYTPENAANRTGIFRWFLKERQVADQREKLRFLREELGMKALLNNHNNLAHDPMVAELRNDFDMVDMHLYVNHPVFPVRRFGLPSYCTQASDLERRLFEIGRRSASRIYGKPFVMTEVNWCSPARYRIECGPLFGGSAALQDWDALFSFAWTHHVEDLQASRRMTTLNLANDPLADAAWRILYFLFRRGDVAPASENFAMKLDSTLTEFPETFRSLAGFARIGLGQKESSLQPADFPVKLPPKTRQFLDAMDAGKPAGSSTGELEFISSRPAMKLITPLSECLVLDQESLDGHFISVRQVNTFSTFSLHSLDGKPLSKSSQMLLIHLTDAANTGEAFVNSSMNLLTDWGKLPVLIKHGRAEITLNAPDLKVTRLRLNGSSNGKVTAVTNNSATVFKADTAGAANTATLYYHIIR